MSRNLQQLIYVLLFVLSLGACADPPKVIQGKVQNYDESAQTLKLSDELKLETNLLFHLEKAEIGAVPKVGDVLRIAYKVKGERNEATRVMNLTRQAELSGGGGH